MRKSISIAVIAAALAAPAISQAAPVSKRLQQVWSMASIGAVSVSQNYKETGTAVTTGGTISGTLDKETGSIKGFELTKNSQWSHTGFKTDILYAAGDTAYDGHNMNTGAPITGVTKNTIFNVNLQLRYGFSLAALPQLAIFPAIEGGIHLWVRDMPNNSETYFNEQVMGELIGAYTVNHFVTVSGGFGAGKTMNPRMHSSYTGNSYTLGTSGINQEWIKVSFVPGQHLGLYAEYKAQSFKYGKSAVDSGGMYEPDSSTKQSTFSFGLKYSF